MAQDYTPTAREQAFLDKVEDTQYKREIINGLSPFLGEKVPEDMAYGLFRELHRTQRDELAAFLAELADLPAGEQTAEEHLERFERHFGDVATLERRIERRWLSAARERQAAAEQVQQAAQR